MRTNRQPQGEGDSTLQKLNDNHAAAVEKLDQLQKQQEKNNEKLLSISDAINVLKRKRAPLPPKSLDDLKMDAKIAQYELWEGELKDKIALEDSQIKDTVLKVIEAEYDLKQYKTIVQKAKATNGTPPKPPDKPPEKGDRKSTRLN